MAVEENGNWLSFKVDYVDQRKQRIITDHVVLRCNFEDRAIRTYIKQEINIKGPANRGVRLLDKILSIQIPSFSKDIEHEKELIHIQLTPFLTDFDAHALWEKDFRSIDEDLNKKVYALYGLNEEEIMFVENNSKPSGWHGSDF